MMTRVRFVMQAAMVSWAAGSMVLSAIPARADSIILVPASEGNRTVQGLPPGEFLIPGPLEVLQNSSDGRIQLLRDSALDFDLSTLTAGPPIASAILRFNVAGALNVVSPPNLFVSGYADSNGVVELSDFGRPSTLVGTTGTLPNSEPTGLNIQFMFDVTDLMRSFVAGGSQFAGFRFGVTGTSIVNVWGSGASDSSRRPRLEITPVPEPSGALLMGLGVAGLSAVTWRRGRLGRHRLDAQTRPAPE